MRRRGFTLIELAVVVVVLIIAASLLIPILRPPHDEGFLTCLAHEQALGQAFGAYTADYARMLPPYNNHSVSGYVTSPLGRANMANAPLIDRRNPSAPALGTLMRYLQRVDVLGCPNDPEAPYFEPTRLFSYTLNGAFLGLPEDQIADPGSKVLLVDECTVADYVFAKYLGSQYSLDAFAEPHNFVHGHGVNCLYVDGHVKWLRDLSWPKAAGGRGFWRLEAGGKE